MQNLLKIDIKWLAYVMIGVLVSSIQFEYILGVRIGFIGIITVFLIRKYSLYRTLIILAIIHILYIVLFNIKYFSLFFFIEALWLGINLKRNKECNLVTMDILLHVFVGIPISFMMIKILQPSFSNEYNYFICIMWAVTNTIAILLGEMIYNYVPILLGAIKKDKTYKKHKIYLKDLLFHAMVLMVSIPILGNTYMNSVKNHELALKQVELYAHGIFRTIQYELGSWNNHEKQKLLLYNAVYRGQLYNLLLAKIPDETMNVIITNQEGRVILSTHSNYKIKDLFSIENLEGVQEIDNEFYKVIPNGEMRFGVVRNYMQQYYIVHQCMANPDINIYVGIQNQDYLLNDLQIALDGLKLLIILWGLIIILMFLLERVVFRNITELNLVTKNLPEQIYKLKDINWEESWTVEIASLQENFKMTAFKLKEMFEDISTLNHELKVSQEKMNEIVYLDPLSHIGNRLKMRKDLSDIKEKTYYKNNLTGVFLLDIDQFKQINDTLGHEKGDKLIMEVARRLRKIEDKEGINAYRLGGDEFVVLAQKENIQAIHKIGDEIIGLFERSFIIDDICMQVGGSVGVSIYPYHTNDIDLAIKYADMAMYKSKELGSASLQMFDETIKESYIRKTMIEKSIRESVENQEFEINYQPVYDLCTGEIVNIEALLRWESKILGQVAPNDFIPIAEELGFMMNLDQWVVQNVCRQIKKWEHKGIQRVPVSINISKKYFKQKAFLITLLSIIEEEDIQPEDIMIEIAESSVIEQAESMGKIIQDLKDKGIQVILDDFGKKHSSISQLIDLPVKDLKLECELIRNIDQDERKQILVKLIISIAHKLHIRTIAEGVQTKEELDYLKKIKCDRAQGRQMCKPCGEVYITKVLSYKQNGPLQ